jgi:serine protease Do
MAVVDINIFTPQIIPMRNHHHLAVMLSGTAIVSALVVTIPTAVQALTGTQVNDIAREVTVLIRGKHGHGSGVIIQKTGSTYYILTAEHVVRQKDDFKIVTADKQAYAIDYSKVKKFAGVDLAIVKFTSDKNYAIAKIGSGKISEGQNVFVSGWPSNGAMGKLAGGELVRQFTSGSISGFLPQPYNGYSMIYTNVTRAGMSGCPVLDTAGRLIGIHGMGDKEDARQLAVSGLNAEMANRLVAKIKLGFNYAVPINVFLQKSNSVGIDSDVLQVDSSPAPQAGEAYVAVAKPDSRDKIDNIQATLQSVNNVTDGVNGTKRTIDNFRRSIGF